MTETIDATLLAEKQAQEEALTLAPEPGESAYSDTTEQWQGTFLTQIQGMIDEAVDRAVSSSLLVPAPPPPSPVTQGTVPFELPTTPPTPPPTYKKHYRCDVTPEIQIQRLDMTSLDRGERPSANPLPGEWIKFLRGHFFTSDDDVIRQIEWMKGRSQLSSDQSQTMGGNPSIYEDDDSPVYRCSAGCDYSTASKNAWIAHMWGTHQLEVTR